ncbi:MAG TPA: hypothetical protein VHG33_06280 [Woeseiaceae bacterium]|nr:hypothetical protein [Woeseiaceae bacterium]
MNQVARLLLLAASAGPVGCGPSNASDTSRDDRVYTLDYVVTLDPETAGARVVLTLEQSDDYQRKLDMSLLGGRISNVEGDGELTVQDGRAVWLPPEDGGQLSWFARIDHLRDEDTYDAYIGDDWALFRGEDIIPSADTRTLKDAESDTRLTFELPDGWSSVTPYFGNDDSFDVDTPDRRFDTPTGWIVLGDLGVRYGTISGIRTKVAGPTGHDIRRLDILAFLRWTLPELLRVLPDFPDRLTIVSAGEPMWRGALSAPQSLYIHADRPLISENGTSTLLHEIVHVGMGLSAKRGADWIVEGFAEFYALEALRRSGTLGKRRFEIAHEDLAEWGREASELCGPRSSGSRTARAVMVLAELDAEIRDETDGRSSLDDVLAELAALDEEITVERFREIAADVAGEAMESLEDLPGCPAA